MFKKGLATLVILLFLGLAVSPSIYADNKMSLDPVPDLDCWGDMEFIEVEPGNTVSGTISVENIGEPLSELNWEITDYPDWSIWTIYPMSGVGLKPEDGYFDIDIEVYITDLPEEEVWDEILIVNVDNPDDYCIVQVHYDPDSVPVVKNTPIKLVFLLINKLRYYEGIEYIQSEEDVLEIIEDDAELSGIVEELESYSCGCEEDNSEFQWSYPVICMLIFPLEIIFLVFRIKLHFDLPYYIIHSIGIKLNCYWL